MTRYFAIWEELALKKLRAPFIATRFKPDALTAPLTHQLFKE
jgi:hypothetical protein